MIGIVIVLSLLILAITIFWFSRGSLRKPESIAYDQTEDVYYISNSGNGKIIAMDGKGKQSIFIDSGLKSPKGLLLQKPYLYVADETNIHAIDLANKRIAATYPIEGSVMLNDIAADRNGHLYITDTLANCLFIFDPLSKGLQKISHPLLNAPNGIAYDRMRHQMLVVSYSSMASILIFDIATRETQVFKETIYSNLDGIAFDDVGRIYFSTWKEQAIVMIPLELNRFVTVASNLKSPADFIFNPKSKQLVIPQLQRNRIRMVDIPKFE